MLWFEVKERNEFVLNDVYKGKWMGKFEWFFYGIFFLIEYGIFYLGNVVEKWIKEVVFLLDGCFWYKINWFLLVL